MSRPAATKGKGEKGGKTQAPTPAVAHEIVAGKFNDHDWNIMQDHDDADEFIDDIVGELCGNVLDVIYKKYIENQLVPYTVMQAKDAILQIIEWQFLSSDVGEVDIDADESWFADEEPEPAVTDCWAQGSVPRTLVIKTPIPEESATMLIEDIQEENIVEDEEPAVSLEPESEVTDTCIGDDVVMEGVKTEKDKEPKEEKKNETKDAKKSKETPRKGGKMYKPHTGKLNNDTFASLTESLDDTERLMDGITKLSSSRSPDTTLLHMPTSCQSILKLQAGRPPGNRDVHYDESGKVISVSKIRPERIPSHRIKTTFKVVDPEVEEAQQRLDSMRSGAFNKHKPRPPADGSPRSFRGRNTSMHFGSQTTVHGKSLDNVAPLPPPLVSNPPKTIKPPSKDPNGLPNFMIEFMDVSPGVVVKEGDRIKRGPRQHPRRMDPLASESKTLGPVAVKAKLPSVTVQELLEHQSPHIRPLNDSPVIPAIINAQPSLKSVRIN